MSSRIEQVLEVIEEVKNAYLTNQSQHSVSSLRKIAVQRVANKRGITTNSVADKYIRQLSPQIENTEDFDKCLSNWLMKGDFQIQQVLFSKVVTQRDKEHIQQFFKNLPLITSDSIVPNEQIEHDNLGDGIVYPDENMVTGKYKEGSLKRLSVNVYERNPKAKRDCIAAHGTRCSVCNFSFEEVYGGIGQDFIHVHHLQMLSSIGIDYIIDPVTDLKPVCPNCHAMIHKRNPPFSIEELKQVLDTHNKRR